MIQFIDVINSNPWLGFLLNVTIKSFVIIAVAGILAFLLRGKSAALRSLVWYMSILGCLMVSVFSLTLSPLEIGVLPEKPVGFEAEVPPENNKPVAAEVSSAPGSSPTAAATSTEVTPPPIQPKATTDESGVLQSNGRKTGFVSLHWTNWIALIWAVVALFLFVRLVVGIGGVWRITARSDDFSGSIRDLQLGSRVGGWRRPVRIRRSDEFTAPIMWGLFRPTILLPADAGDWGGERLRAVLLHELAHIRRNDWESQLIAQMMCVVYWFNPLVWFAARRMRVEAERACDDYVLSTGYQSTDYAQHLVDIARNVKRADSASRASVAIAHSSKIEERIRMILAENLNRRPLTKVSLVSGYCIVIFFAMQLGAMRLVEAGNHENGLYQEIQSVSNSHPEPLAEDATEEDKEAWREGSQRNMEGVIALCDKFLSAFPESDRYDEIWYEKLICLRRLGHNTEYESGIAAFLLERPASKYANRLRKLRAYYLESQFKFPEALAEWDKIDDPAMLYEVYDRKGQIYSRMNNWEKRAEYDLLRAELILGKPAPEFSHTSVYGNPVSLGALRGKVVVLYHWSTRDGRTVRADDTGGEITNLKHLYAKHSNNPDFVLVCVCTDSSESRLKEFVNTHAMPGNHLLLKHDEVPHQFGVYGLPYYVVVDKTGILRESAHGFELRDLEIELLVVALLKEEMNAPGDLIIPRISQTRAEIYSFQDQKKKTIAEYEKVIAFMPNTPHLVSEIRYRKFNLLMEEIYRKREQPDAMTALMNKAYNQIIEASLPSTGRDVDQALQLATLFSRQGDQEKTWRLFQLAVIHDDGNYNSVINYAKQNPERFAAIQDMPEFQKLLASAPQTEAEKRNAEETRKWEMYADELSAAHKSFTAVEADDEIFTGVILTRTGHILVPAIVTEARIIRAKIVDYLQATVVAVDATSGLAVVQVKGPRNLRPVALGNVDNLREYEPIVISTRGYPNVLGLPPEIDQQALGRLVERRASVMQLEIDDDGKVAVLKVATPGRLGEIIRGDAIVYHDGRLLAVSPENEVKYANWGPSTDPIPIDQIRAALERMNMTQLMNGTAGNQRKNLSR